MCSRIRLLHPSSCSIDRCRRVRPNASLKSSARPPCRGRFAYFKFVLGGMAAGGFRSDEPPIDSNWATEQQYADISEWLKSNIAATDTIWLKCEIGTMTYDSGLQLLNEFSDQNIVTVQYLGEHAGSMSKLLYARRPKHELVRCPSFVLDQRGDAPSMMSASSQGARLGGVLIKEWSISSKWTPESRVYLWQVTPERSFAEYPRGCQVP